MTRNAAVLAACLMLGACALFEPMADKAAPPKPEPAAYLIFFNLDSADILPPGRAVIARVAADAAEAKPAAISVTGFADRTGSAAHNRALSNRRAEAVAGALREAGLPEAMVRTRARGEEEAIDLAVAGRRVEIRFIASE
jgi:outer membrane protein OmpA-like peptidoglycan-associated protein